MCNFGDIEDSLIKDRIICGTRESSLQERLLQETALTLEKCLLDNNVCSTVITITATSAKLVHRLKLKEPRKQDRDRLSNSVTITVQSLFYGKQHKRQK